jgi:aldose 1-epimerase
MRDVSLNSIRPLATGLMWLDDPAVVATVVTLSAGALP